MRISRQGVGDDSPKQFYSNNEIDHNVVDPRYSVSVVNGVMVNVGIKRVTFEDAGKITLNIVFRRQHSTVDVTTIGTVLAKADSKLYFTF